MAIVKEVEIKVNADNATDELKKVNDSIQDVDESTDDLSGSLDNMSGGAVASFTKMKKGLTTAVKGFKTLKGAIAATGIGLLLIAVTSLTAAFKSSEEGQNKLAKIMGVIGSVVSNLNDVLANLGEKLIKVFEDPQQAIKNFGELIKTNIKNRIDGLLELIPALSKAINLAFKGQFKEAGKVAVDAVGKVTLGVESVTESVKSATEAIKTFSKEVQEDANKAADISDKRAKADKVERELLVERAEANREYSDLLVKSAEKEKFTAEERIGFLEEAGRIDDEITQKEIAAAKLRYEAKQEENKLSKSTKEDLDEEARLKAAVIELETARLRKAKSVAAQIVTAQREEQAAINAKAKETQDAIDAETKAKEEAAAKEKKLRDDQLKADKKAADEKIALDRAVQNAKLSIAVNTASILMQMVDEDSKAYKSLAIAQAAISGFQGAQNAFATAAASPISTVFPAYPFIQAGLAGAFSIAQIAKIKSTDPTGGTSATASTTARTSFSGSTPSAQAPNLNVVQGTASNQISDSISNQNEKPIKTYVLSSDVTTAQELDRKAETAASF